MAGAGRGAVLWAVVGNAFLTVIKGAAFLVSGSGAMMAETVHSFADTANQALLYVGIRRSLRPADEDFHYGYGADRYVFALLSAAGIFFIGCGVTVYHGIHSLLHPPELSLTWIVFAVLGVSFVVDGVVLMKAVGEVRAKKGKESFLHFVRHSTDPTLIAVLFEDFVATLGVVVALVGIGLSAATGNPMFDGISSIVIGTLLGLLAGWLGWRNRTLILGPSIPDRDHAQVLAFLESQPSVAAVRKMRTRILAADRFRISAEIDYDGRVLGRSHATWIAERAAGIVSPQEWEEMAADFGERLLDELGREVNRIEAALHQEFPDAGDVDLESD